MVRWEKCNNERMFQGVSGSDTVSVNETKIVRNLDEIEGGTNLLWTFVQQGTDQTLCII